MARQITNEEWSDFIKVATDSIKSKGPTFIEDVATALDDEVKCNYQVCHWLFIRIIYFACGSEAADYAMNSDYQISFYRTGCWTRLLTLKAQYI